MRNQHRKRPFSSLRIIPFIGYGNTNEVFISGIVIAKNGLSKPVEGQTKWQNIKAMMKRYLNNEIEYADVEVTFMGVKQNVTTDKYGIYRSNFNIKSGTEIKGLWHKAYVTFPSLEVGAPSEVMPFKDDQVECEVMIVDNHPEFCILSDVDDTILVSHATQKLQKFMLMMLNNALTRMPFEGVSAFYYALQKGRDNRRINPVFYVSNSEWNLYDLLYEFIEFNRIPKGPLLLREMSVSIWRPWKIRDVNKNHKMEVIRRLFILYDPMKFILIGDSGQKDPQIYSAIVREFPGRVPAIYIRDIGIKPNLKKIQVILNSLHEDGITEMIVVKDSEAAARHAIEKGYISGENLDFIRYEKEKDANN